MYKPKGLNKDIYCYDVNSLYPLVMSNNPVGQIMQFEAILDNKYWIGDVTLSTKNDLYQFNYIIMYLIKVEQFHLMVNLILN